MSKSKKSSSIKQLQRTVHGTEKKFCYEIAIDKNINIYRLKAENCESELIISDNRNIFCQAYEWRAPFVFQTENRERPYLE